MSKRILIVEDDHLNRMLLCAVLQGSGFLVEEVSNGADAIAAVKRFAPDLITMDINLPNVSGLELIKILKADQVLRTIPIIAITAYIGRGEDAFIRAAGADYLITKPISLKPFLEAVSKLLPKGNAPS